MICSKRTVVHGLALKCVSGLAFKSVSTLTSTFYNTSSFTFRFFKTNLIAALHDCISLSQEHLKSGALDDEKIHSNLTAAVSHLTPSFTFLSPIVRIVPLSL